MTAFTAVYWHCSFELAKVDSFLVTCPTILTVEHIASFLRWIFEMAFIALCFDVPADQGVGV